MQAGSISVVLSRLEDRGLVRHKGTFWALGDDDVAVSTGTLEGTQPANDRFSAEDIDEWVRHVVMDWAARLEQWELVQQFRGATLEP